MKTFDAHAMFCLRPDGGHSLLNPQCDSATAPAFCAAFASMSGMLDGCETQEDLDEAVRHGIWLIGEGMQTQDDLHKEVMGVIAEVDRWGQQAEAGMH